MTRARNTRLPVFRALSLFGLGVVWAVACGGPQKLGNAGSVCFRSDDCQAGLACVPEIVGAEKRVCSPDLTGIVSMVDGAPLEAAPPVAMAGAVGVGGDGATSGAPAAAGATGKAGAGSGGSSGSGAAGAGAPAGGAAAAGAPAGGAPAAGAPAAGSSGSAAAGAPAGGAPAGSGGS